jgi:hypothetical protein
VRQHAVDTDSCEDQGNDTEYTQETRR